METNRKFYVTSNRILDADIVGDVEYHPEGSPTGMNIIGTDFSSKPDLRRRSELHISFKDPERKWISLYGDEADTAWKNYRRAVDINGEGWTEA